MRVTGQISLLFNENEEPRASRLGAWHCAQTYFTLELSTRLAERCYFQPSDSQQAGPEALGLAHPQCQARSTPLQDSRLCVLTHHSCISKLHYFLYRDLLKRSYCSAWKLVFT